MTPSTPQSMSDFPLNQFSRLLANVALEPMRQSLVEQHRRLLDDIDTAISRNNGENRRG